MQDWIRNKRRSAELYEDELTACIFGPLRYMGPRQAWQACLILLGHSDRAQNSGREPTNVCIRFWPHFSRTEGEGHHVEPDVHVVAWNGDVLLGTILVETKWNSGLQKNQLLDQWRFVTVGDNHGAEVRNCSKHVLLGSQPRRDDVAIKEQMDAAREQGIEWDGRLFVLPWYEVAARLAGLRCLHGPIETWRQDVVAFLVRQGITAFDGFPCDRLKPVRLMQWRFEAYTTPALLEVGLLNWLFNEGNGNAA